MLPHLLSARLLQSGDVDSGGNGALSVLTSLASRSGDCNCFSANLALSVCSESLFPPEVCPSPCAVPSRAADGPSGRDSVLWARRQPRGPSASCRDSRLWLATGATTGLALSARGAGSPAGGAGDTISQPLVSPRRTGPAGSHGVRGRAAASAQEPVWGRAAQPSLPSGHPWPRGATSTVVPASSSAWPPKAALTQPQARP